MCSCAAATAMRAIQEQRGKYKHLRSFVWIRRLRAGGLVDVMEMEMGWEGWTSTRGRPPVRVARDCSHLIKN